MTGEPASSQECMVRGASLCKDHSGVSAEIDGQRLNASYSLHDQGDQQVTRLRLPAPAREPNAISMGAKSAQGWTCSDTGRDSLNVAAPARSAGGTGLLQLLLNAMGLWWPITVLGLT